MTIAALVQLATTRSGAMITDKNLKATAVLAIVLDLSKNGTQTYFVEPYVNGREVGYSIRLRDTGGAANNLTRGWPQATFSENRNSDDIVVYLGTTTNFSMQGNVPDEETYRSATYYPFDGYLAAAKAIVEYFEE